ncbi:MAG: methylenetetrahydrofolate reductase [Stackebrandtia sp.]
MTLTIPKVRSKPKPKWQAVSPLLSQPRLEVLPMGGIVDQVAKLPQGTTVTVTSSPARGTMATLEVAERLAGLGMRAVPHLSARGMRDEAELVEVLHRLDNAGIRDAFVVGGDAAGGDSPYADGLALLEAMHSLGHRLDAVGVPAYPEGHSHIDDETLWAALEAKQRYATYAVTQMCFDAETICGFVGEARRRGIWLPMVAGVPGVVDMAKLLRVSMRIGIGDSLKFARGNGRTVRKLLRIRGYRPDSLVRKLNSRVRDGHCELSGLHIYTFNHVAAAARWLGHARRRLTV